MEGERIERYLLFMWQEYEPLGGHSDYRGAFPSPEDAKRQIKQGHSWQIVDSFTFTVFEEGD